MLEVKCEDYLKSVRKFAQETGQVDKLQDRLNYLARFACDPANPSGALEATKCVLFKDSAPNSFLFDMLKKGSDSKYRFWFNGGLIYYGQNDSGVGAPQFSVRVSGSDSGWEINT